VMIWSNVTRDSRRADHARNQCSLTRIGSAKVTECC
jgi:hypothetical protein